MAKLAVKVFRAGTEGMEVALDKGQNVEDALDKIGLNKKDSEIVQINGSIKSLTSKLKDGDVVVLAKNIEGGAI